MCVAALLFVAVVMASCGTAKSSSGANTPTFTSPTTSTSTSTLTASRLPPIIYRGSGLAPPASSPKVPLVIALHGSFGNPLDMQGLTKFEHVADEHGFVVAYLASSDLNHPWRPPSDLNYVSSMIDQITASQNIDPSRVYVTGFSAGGYETWRAGCELSSKVAAIAIVSGAMNGPLYNSCAPSRPVSQMLMVGSSDSTRYTGVPGRLPSPFQTTAKWRALDGCSSQVTQSGQVSTVSQQTWGACTDGSAVALYIVHGAGHVWPPIGAGAPQDYSASEAVWAFFAAHRAAPRTVGAKLTSVRVMRKGKSRAVVSSFRLGEPVTVVETIARGHRTLLRKVFQLQRGANNVAANLAVPHSVGAGRYTIGVAIGDQYGRKLIVLRSVRLP
jgi:polyhydroxybutyrate depolymerase